jgi:RNA polymerase sigma-70 factor, ECF subfamily
MNPELFEDLRGAMFSLAYRMLGSVSEAEDVVQEAFLRVYRDTAHTEIDSPKAYMAAVTTRLAIDHLRSARVRRERYVGDWLPEPLLTSDAEVARAAETADSLSLAFLVLLESLSPVERAVFLLRDVFGYEYGAIAKVVGKSEDNCRQLAARARRHVDERKPRFEASREQRDELARRFFEACEAGDTDALIELLAADVVVYGDGGGKAPALAEPVHGASRASRMLVGWFRQAAEFGVRFRPAEVNGQPGAVLRTPDGRVVGVLALDIADGTVQSVRSIINPDKLGHLGAVVDVREALRERRRG